MQVIRRTTAGIIHAANNLGYSGFGFTHTSPAAAVIADGFGNEIARANIGEAAGGADGQMIRSPIPCVGLQVVSITAGSVLFLYVE